MKTVMSLSAAALLAAGIAACSSSTTTTNNSAATATASPTSMSGIERFTGKLTGAPALANNATIPLRYAGPVNTTGSFDTGSPPPAKGQNHTFTTAAGNFTVTISATPKSVQKLLSSSTCLFEFVTTVPYKANGAASTGKFAGSSGSGVVTVSFHAFLPKLTNGKCNLSNSAQPLAKGASAVFAAAGPLAVKP
jgi:hypothetical protein